MQERGCALTAVARVIPPCSVLCAVLPRTGLPRSGAWGAPGAPAADSDLPPAVWDATVPELEDPATAEGRAPLLLHASGEYSCGVQKAGSSPASQLSAGCFRRGCPQKPRSGPVRAARSPAGRRVCLVSSVTAGDGSCTLQGVALLRCSGTVASHVRVARVARGPVGTGDR